MKNSLPVMKSMQDALALAKKENDTFYLVAFIIINWMANVAMEAMAEYAEKKEARMRRMQEGQAWRGFLRLFRQPADDYYPRVLNHIYRFCDYDDDLTDFLRWSALALSFEHDCLGDFIGPKAVGVARSPAEEFVLIRRSIERWCDWIDAAAHYQTHANWHLEPINYDPDPENRQLAGLGSLQKHFTDMSEDARKEWEWFHTLTAEKFKNSPKWQMVGKAMASNQTRTWNYLNQDFGIISIWPLVKRYNWTYRDLMAVLQGLLPPPHRYPINTEQDLAAYCQNVLGLRKLGPAGRSSPDGKPLGWQVAFKVCNVSPKSS
jgi:hypothetical protein